MKCPYCGNTIKDKVLCCPFCGNILDNEDPLENYSNNLVNQDNKDPFDEYNSKKKINSNQFKALKIISSIIVLCMFGFVASSIIVPIFRLPFYIPFIFFGANFLFIMILVIYMFCNINNFKK